MDLRDLPRDPLRPLRDRLLLPFPGGRRHDRHRRADAHRLDGVRAGAAPPGRDLPAAVPRPVRRLAHGQPGDPRRRARADDQRAGGVPGQRARRHPAFRPPARRDHRLQSRLPGRRQVLQGTLRVDRARQRALARRPRRAHARGLPRAALPRLHRRHGLRAARHPGRLHPPLGADARRERREPRPGRVHGQGEGHARAGRRRTTTRTRPNSPRPNR